MALIAQYKGRCVDCGGGIEEGAWIIRRDDGYAHLTCEDTPEIGLRSGEVVCAECFTVKASDGSCICGVV